MPPVSFALRMRGALNEGVLERALEAIVARHEVLRTRYTEGPNGPVQRIEEATPVELARVDLREMGLEERQQRLEGVIAERQQPFDATVGPMMRATLVRLASDESALVMAAHPLVADDESLEVLGREVSALCQAFQEGRSSPLEPLPVQYADFAAWQHEWLSGLAQEGELRYWRQKLAGLRPLELPSDRPRPPTYALAGASVRFTIGAELAAAVAELGRARDATPFMVLLAAFESLLQRYTGKTDLGVGTSTTGRTRAEVEPLIGPFANTLVLRSDLSGAPTFSEVLERVRGTVLEAQAHPEMPFGRLVEALQAPGESSRFPLVSVRFGLQERATAGFALPGLEVEPLPVRSELVRAELELQLEFQADGSLAGRLTYATALFDAPSMARRAGHYVRLLEQVTREPATRLSKLRLLDEAERRLVVEEWNRTSIPLPERCLHELFEERARATPYAVAAVFGGEQLTYARLNARANQLAHYLRGLGVGSDSLVGVCMQRSLEMVVALVGIHKAGGAYVPLDPEHPRARLALLLADTGVKVVLTETGVTGRFDQTQVTVVPLDGDREKLEAQPEHDPVSGVQLDNLAYGIYTSGSTGRPKGVMISHRGIRNRVLWAVREHRLSPTDRLLQKTTLTFDAAGWEFFGPLVSGGTVVMAAPGAQKDMAAMARAVVEHEVTVLQLVPSVLRLLVDEPGFVDCTSLRLMFVAGEPLTAELCRRLMEKVKVELINTYGPTECSIDATSWRYSAEAGERIPIGQPLQNCRILILDEHGEPTPVGVAGEVHIGGLGLARCYLGQPGLTAERFVPDAHAREPGQRLYRTGDLGRWLPDGNIEFLGRRDHQVKLRGFRIELGEIEEALGKHPKVKSAVVLVRDGEAGEKQLVGYAVPHGAPPTATELRAFLRDRLPDYMVPSAFVVLERWPLNSSGKVDRAALPAPEGSRPELGEDFVAPRTPVEMYIATLWCQVLGVNRIGVHDNFFEVGGQSLLATRMLARLRTAFNVDLPLGRLLKAPTIAQLAEAIGKLRPGGEVAPIIPRPRSGSLVLSFAQQRLWFLHQMDPGSLEYLEPLLLRLQGPLNEGALRRALDESVARHEVLRTRYVEQEGGPVQVIDAPAPVELGSIDLRALAPEERERRLGAWLEAEQRRLFNLESGPVLRAALARLAPDEHVLLVMMHHIATDAWSMAIFARELGELYRAACEGLPSPLQPLPVQYADFTLWQREWLVGKVLDRQLSYWKKKLAGLEPLELPTDRPRPPVRNPAGAAVWFSIRKAVAADVARVAIEQKATPFMVALTALKALLYRYTGKTDLAVGTPIAGRTRTEVEPLIGFFVNTLALRSDLAGDPSLAEVLGRVRESALEAYAHQDVPFERLVDALQPERDLSRSPLFQVMFSLQNSVARFEFAGLHVEMLQEARESAKFDLALFLAEREDGSLAGRLDYATALFDRPTAERLVAHYMRLLEEFCSEPEKRLSELELLGGAERRRLLVEWNDTAVKMPERSLHELFEARVRATPDAVAVIFGDERLTYAELNARANRLAWELRARGVGPETVVGICLERRLELWVALLGVLKAGGAYLPLDPEHPTERLGYMLSDSGARWLITQKALLSRLEGSKAEPVLLDNAPEWLSTGPDGDLPPLGDALNLAYVIYTSGSTGRPKGVMVTRGSLTNLACSMAQRPGFQAKDVLVAVTTVSFDIAALELYVPLLVGGRVVLASGEQTRDGRLLAALIQDSGAMKVQGTPSLWRLLLDVGWTPRPGFTVLCGGEKLPAELALRLTETGADIWDVYGPTETTIWSSAALLGTGGRVVRWAPVANTTIHVLDGALNLVPIGVLGELYIGGDGVARGYSGRPELTAERFVPEPYATTPGQRLYRTGDLARRHADGSVEILGRQDSQVKVRGYRIELGEIEAILSRHPELAAVAVIAPRSSDGETSIAAYIVARDPQNAPSANEVRAYLGERLPSYMVPAFIVTLPALPLTPNGKVDRKALPMPGKSRSEQEHEYVAPRTPTESQLAVIWSQVMGLDRVGANDNFFSLGGHSLLATRVVSRVREVLKIELPVAQIFKTPTVAALAKALSGLESGGSGASIAPRPRDGAPPLSFAQQRLWFLDKLEPRSVEYLIPLTFRVRGALDEEALQRALMALVERHEVLRTRYLEAESGPVQVIESSAAPQVVSVELSALPREERESRLRELMREEGRQPFELGAGPLLRLLRVRLSEEEEALVVTVHHIASDGWSMGVLTHELGELYRSFKAGLAPSLAPLSIQYADYALWQREWLSGAVLERQLDYWTKRLAGVASLELPTDRPRPPVRSSAGALLRFEVPARVAQRLVQLGRARDATPFMVLLAAFQALLHRYSGQADIAVGTPIAGRIRSELEPLIGLFVNTLVVRSDLSGDPSFSSLVEQVRERSLEAYAHQELPFERLVDTLQLERDLSRNPIFQVLFSLQNVETVHPTFGDLATEEVPAELEVSKFDLSLYLEERQGGVLSGVVEYSTALFDRVTVERLAGHYVRLLERIAEVPETRLSQLELLGEVEKRQLLEEWSGARSEVPEHCIHELFEQQVRATPEAVAVGFGKQQLSYAQLDARANQLAHYLRKKGVGPEARVGVYLERSVEMVVGLMGVLKAGGAYVPLDPSYPAERVKWMLEDARPEVVLTAEGLKERLEWKQGEVVSLDTGWAEVARQPESRPERVEGPDTLAYVIFTSGSTGRPKGAMNAHRGVSNRLLWMQSEYGLGANDTVLQKTPFSFDVSVWEFFWPLMTGARLVVAEPGGHQDPAYLQRLIVEERISTVHFVPSMLQAFLDEPGVERCTSLKRVVCSGEALSSELKERCLKLLPWVGLHNLYGPTEAAVDVTYHACQVGDGRSSVPIGKPVANTQIRILDERLRPVPVGVAGELYIGGVQVGRGYLGRPELTAERFIPDAFGGQEGARLYRTGDLARWLADGSIEYLGRVDFQVKLRGFRIELGEIEAVLLGHPTVAAVVVVAQRSKAGDLYLVAYVVSREARSDVEALRAHLSERLPSYMVPAVLMQLEQLPLTPSGKVDRKALPQPDEMRSQLARDYVAPRTPAEEQMVAVWAEVLGVDRVGVHDNFFNLGGDSIRAVRVVGALRSHGVAVSVQELFKHPTVAWLCSIDTPERARSEEELRVAPFELLKPADRAALPPDVEDAYPLSMVQAGMLYELLADTRLNVYHNITCFRVPDTGTFSLPAFEEAAQVLTRQHELLRTSFELDAYSEPLQLIHRESRMVVEYRDLRGLDEQAQRAAIDAHIVDVRRHPLDLRKPPLMCFWVHQVADDAWWLSVVENHAILDGWSHHFNLTEVIEYYRAIREGQEPKVAPQSPTRFADFIALEQRTLQSSETRAFWASHLQGYERHALPESWGSQDEADYARYYYVRIPLKELEPGIRRLARLSGVSRKSVLLAAHLKVMSMISGQRRFITGLICNGRLERAGGDQVRGMFLNSVPFTMNLEAMTWRELAQAAFAEEVELWPHRRYPLPALQREWGEGGALFDVAFNYLDFHNWKADAFDLQQIVDTSPNEIPLMVSTEPGRLLLTVRARYIAPHYGERLGQLYREVLSRMVAEPEGDVLQLPLPEVERQQLLVTWNQTSADYPREHTLVSLFEARAAQAPEAVAVTFEGHSLTYRELNARANQLARHLQGLGVGPESRVGISLMRSPEMVVALLGTLKAGGAYVPLDPTYPADRVSFMLQDSQASVIITQQTVESRLPPSSAPRVRLDADVAEIARQPDGDLPSRLTADNAAYLLYTSGSTGRPVGVSGLHRGTLNRFQWMWRTFPFSEGEVCCQKTTINFSDAVWEIFGPLLQGVPLVLLPDDVSKDPERLVQHLSAAGVTRMVLVPSLLRAILELPVDLASKLRRLKWWTTSGEALPHELAVAFKARLPHATLLNLYGMSEGSADSTCFVLRPEDPVAVLIGRPIDNTQVYVLDSLLQPVPVEVPGDLYVGGVGLARGYWGRPELTAERFIPNPFASSESDVGSRLYRPGDRARWLSNGQLEYLGRADHQVKIRGFRIELGEIESLLKGHSMVARSVVVARARSGTQSEQQLVAYVVLRPETPPSIVGALRQLLRQRLPEYMVPAAFVVLPELPLTPTGKIDRRALPAPEMKVERAARVAPSTPIQEVLCGIFDEVLGQTRVGVEDDFFELGGHSLLVMQVVSRVRSVLRVDLTIRALFENPTVAKLARVVESARVEGKDAFPPLRSASRAGELPLSFSQQRLWFIDQLQPGNVSYNIPVALRLRGTLDVTALARGFEAIIERHEVLRTTFALRDGKVVQVISPSAQVALEPVELEHLPQEACEARAKGILREEAQRPFALMGGSLLRTTLLRLSPSEHLLLVTLHHVVTDAWSMNVLVRELSALYEAFREGRPSPLEPLAVQYADYALWQREWLSSRMLEKQLDYWRRQLAGLEPLDLPTDRPRPPTVTSGGGVLAVRLPPVLSKELVAVSRQHGVTPFMTLLAAFQALLSRYTGKADIAVGVPTAGRTVAEVEPLIGFFVNTLVMRSDLSGDPTLTQLLGRVRETALQAYAHPDVPFEHLVEALQPERDLSRNPLFQVMFILRNVGPTRFQLAGLEVEDVQVPLDAAKFDLTLQLEEQEDGALEGTLEYATALFDPPTIERLAGHFQRLLEQFTTAPQTRLSQLELLGEAERQRLLLEWNGAAVEVPDRSLHELFEDQARATPEAIAVVFGEQRLTYAGLNARANQVARHLRALGVGPDSVVGVYLRRSHEVLVALLGVLKAGGAYVPLDPEHPAERLMYMLEDAGARWILTQRELADRVTGSQASVWLLDEEEERLAAQPDGNLPVFGSAGNLAYVMYTSGSTGRPKGVMISRAALTNLARAMSERPGFTAKDVMVAVTTVSFDIAAVELYVPLLVGAKVVMASREQVRDVRQLASLIEDSRASVVQATPSLWKLLLDAGFSRPRQPFKVLCGGEKLPAELARRLTDTGAQVWDVYGPTETTVWSSTARLKEGWVVDWEPVANNTLHVLDAGLGLAPIGVVGELYIGGDGLARGYRGRPDLTAERFVPDPHATAPGQRLYRTGDLARRHADGHIEILGRQDFQVKLRGFRIELEEIEAQLSRHPGVRSGVVLARELSPGDMRLIGYVVPQGQAPTASELGAFLRGRLPEYMVPSLWVTLDALPLMTSGKVDRKALPLPGAERPELSRVYVAPRNPREEQMASVWAEVLGVGRVGVHDNFFELGGESMRAIRLVTALRGHGRGVSVQQLFKHPTIAMLCSVDEHAVMEEVRVAPFELLSPADRAALPEGLEDAYPLSMVQAGMLFEMMAESGRHLYHNLDRQLIEDDGPFDLKALEDAVRLVGSRHELLRTSFELDSYSEPLQLVHRQARAETQFKDLRGLAETEWRKALEEDTRRMLERPFAFGTPPLLRLHIHQITDTSWWLTLDYAHAVLDGWSHSALSPELLECYRAVRDGRVPIALAPPTTRFADFIALERQALRSRETREFWTARVQGYDRLKLPDTWAASKESAPSLYDILIPIADLEPGLRRLVQVAGVSRKSVLLAAHLKVMSTLSGQRRFFSGLVSNARPESQGSEQMMGMFLNSVPYAVELSAPTWRTLVQDVFAEEIALWPNRQYPLPALQREWGKGERLIDVVFNYVDFEVLDHSAIDLGNTLNVGATELGLTVSASAVDLRLWVWPRLIGREHAALVAQLYRETLAAMAADPEGDARRSVLPAAEKGRVLREWNDTSVELPERCLHELFEAQARATPEAVAVVFGGERLTYAELDAQANRVAHHLRALGVGPDVLVGLCLQRSLEMVVALVGIHKAGGAYVPLDPEYPRERLDYLLADTAVKVVVAETSLAERVVETGRQVILMDRDREAISARPASQPGVHLHPDNLAYVIYTSGSTGRPKGVAIPHQGILNRVLWAVREHRFTPADRMLQKTTISFDAAGWEFYAPLVSGGTVVMAPPGAQKDPAAMVRAVAEHGVTVLQLVPSMLRLIVDEPRLSQCTALRLMFSAGEPLAADLCRRLMDRGRVQLINTYGPTECSIDATAWKYQPEAGERIPIGQPLQNTRILILDDRGEPVPVGVPGELHIGGVGLARCYLGQPELTAERFVPDPYAQQPGQRLYRTGDLARWLPDGNVEFLGRLDNQIKLRGFRIELGEIEAALDKHPKVKTSVVEVKESGDGEKLLVGYVQPKVEWPEASELRAFLRERLPEYMVPSAFKVVETWPFTTSGKVDRRALPPPEELLREQADYVAPRTAMEAQVVATFAQVLKMDRVGVEDGFFDLGGHSLLATRVVSKLREALNVELPLASLFEAQTAAKLAVMLEGLQRETDSALLVPRDRAEPLPLSFAQQRLWFLDRLEPGSAEYLVPLAFRLRGALNEEALRRALDALVARHEVLRTRYVDTGNGTVQVSDLPAQVKLETVNLSVVPPEAQARRLDELMTVEQRRPFDLATGPVLRAALVRLGAEEHVLLITLHHVASDAWSMSVLGRELGALYRAFHEGRPSPLEPLAVQYADYAVWQRERLTGDVLERQLGYWKKKLAHLAPLELSTDRPRPPVRTIAGAIVPFQIRREVVEGLAELGRAQGATPFMVLLTAFQSLLHRYTGRTDIAVGTPIAGRTRAEVEPLIGCFINTLVLRSDLSGDPAFSSLLRRVRDTALEAYAHQDVPFEKLVDVLQPERDLSRNPLFQVMFVYQNAEAAQFEFAGLQVEDVPGRWETSKFDLTLQLFEQQDGTLRGALEYSTGLFDRSTVERLAGHFQRLLERIHLTPEQRLSRLDILGAAERRQLLVEWNETRVEYPREACIHELFEEQAAKTPDAVAVEFGSERVTYRELNRRANQLAHHLRALGVGPEVVVGLSARRSVEMVVGLLGILKAGGAYLPLEPSTPRDRLELMVREARVAVVVAKERLAWGPVHGERQVWLAEDGEVIGKQSAENPVAGVEAGNLAYVLFTSGSTGGPKGVCVPHRGVVRLVKGTDFVTLSEREVFLQLAPLAFDASTFEVWGSLLHGAKLVVFADHTPTMEELGEALVRHGVTTLWLTAALFDQMQASQGKALRGVRQLLAGGDVLPVDRVKERLAEGGLLINGYGPTEVTTFTCCYPMTEVGQVGQSVSIGRPIANTQVYVLNERLEPVPVGVPGELYVGGDGLAVGYLNRPELTAERFIPDPFGGQPGARLYRTGDQVKYLVDGRLEFLGRLDTQVKVRGYRIEPGEIEAHLAAHPGVRAAVVVARQLRPGDVRLVGYFVPQAQVPTVSQLQALLRQRLPEYMVPSSWVALEQLPLTPSGKVDRKALPLPDMPGSEPTREYMAPRTPAEQQIAAIWSEVLGHDRIGVHDNFFELGGHSLLATRVATRLQQTFDVDILLRRIFEAPTVAALAVVVEAAIEAQISQLSDAEAEVMLSRMEKL